MKKSNLTRFAVSMMFFLAVAAWFTTGLAGAAEYVSVVKDGVNLRSGPSTNNEILWTLPAHYPLKVVTRKGKWLKVTDMDGDKGWIYGPLVSTTPYVIVRVKEGNVRSGPGTNFEKVGTVEREVILRKVGAKGDWIQFSHPQLKGWIHRKLVWP